MIPTPTAVTDWDPAGCPAEGSDVHGPLQPEPLFKWVVSSEPDCRVAQETAAAFQSERFNETPHLLWFAEKMSHARQNWVTLETALRGTTSYGLQRASCELLDLIYFFGHHLGSGAAGSPQQQIDRLVESSRKMLDLEQDWDGEGASPIEEPTWKRAVEFLRRNASVLWKSYGCRIDNLTLAPLADGSIDLHWKMANRELLINIPPTTQRWADYYGDNRKGGNIVKGTLDTESANHWLFVWLCE